METDEQKRIAAIEKLINMFKPERVVNIGVSIVSLVLLLCAGGILVFDMMFKQDCPSVTQLGLLFGPSGLIGYSVNRLLHMWDQAYQILVFIPSRKEN